MAMKRSFVGVTVLFSALAVGVPSTEALAFQGHGSKAKEHKAREKDQAKEHKQDHKEAEKRHKRDDKRDEKHDKRHDKHDKRDVIRDDHRDDRPDSRRDGPNERVVVIDRDGHTRIIRDYGRNLPPGLAKRESLPPGLRRQLRERGTLPPGLQKRLVLVPADLGARLPDVPTYYTRYFAGDDLIIIDTRTNTIAAIVRDIWR